jgi:Mlc titration factor MtfA (ptsG expression regulator)
MKLILLLAILSLIFLYFRRRKRQQATLQQSNAIEKDTMHTLLKEHVAFYQRLNEEDQQMFRERVQHFLNTVRITAVRDASLTLIDKLYIASSAIIPIFAFADWSYNNLDEVLVYPGVFTTEFDMEDEERNVAGMVGNGAMNRMMILSLPSLRAGFEQHATGNTAIHEFVHLLDKADGATDGVPEYMIPKSLVAPWIKHMHRTINEIRNNQSDINPYAATNEAEFFAVISEYFFQKPLFLKEHHPELFMILEQTYRNSLHKTSQKSYS